MTMRVPKDYQLLFKQLRSQGFEIRSCPSGHFKVTKDQRFVMTVSGSPGDWRARTNMVKILEREYGFDPKLSVKDARKARGQ